ncbi:DUF779 domain-containing protein [Rhodobacteraceae bacterium]|nr:DUF779 domain-containing protein [Paracoccaceae bacterium]
MAVHATPAALELLEAIISAHGPVLFHQSAGCCDGSAPMCYPKEEFKLGNSDHLMGFVAGTPVYMADNLRDLWQDQDLVLDAKPGRGGGVFSLDNGRDAHFISKPIAKRNVPK